MYLYDSNTANVCGIYIGVLVSLCNVIFCTEISISITEETMKNCLQQIEQLKTCVKGHRKMEEVIWILLRANCLFFFPKKM